MIRHSRLQYPRRRAMASRRRAITSAGVGRRFRSFCLLIACPSFAAGCLPPLLGKQCVVPDPLGPERLLIQPVELFYLPPHVRLVHAAEDPALKAELPKIRCDGPPRGGGSICRFVRLLGAVPYPIFAMPCRIGSFRGSAVSIYFHSIPSPHSVITPPAPDDHPDHHANHHRKNGDIRQAVQNNAVINEHIFVLVKVSSSVYSSVAMPETLPPLPEEPKFVACGGSSFVTAPSCPF